jgi:hypothetical protein
MWEALPKAKKDKNGKSVKGFEEVIDSESFLALMRALEDSINEILINEDPLQDN